MIKTSDTYNPYTPVRHVGIKIRYGVEDMMAAKNASATAGETGRLDRLSQTIDGEGEIDGKYATLEPCEWGLDGSFVVLPDDIANVQTGWWGGALSGADGVFTSPPWVRYDFSVAVSTIGWTLDFDHVGGQYATAVRATVYDADGGVVRIETFFATGATLYMPCQIADYYGVKFEFLSTSEPFRWVRLVEVTFGLVEVLDSSTIESAKISYGVDLVSDTIPSRELEFSFDNSDKKYNLLDPSGIYEYLQEGQRIQAALGINGEYVDMGSFYFTSARASDNILVPTIQANDLIWALDREVFRGGDGAEMALRDAVAAVISRSDLSIQYGDGVGDRTVVMAVPDGASRREALRLLAQAAMCTVWIGRNETIHIADLSAAPLAVDTITENELYDYTGVSVTEKVDRVEVIVENTYIKDGGKTVYSAGEGDRLVKVENCCVAPSAGGAVADWYLAHMQRRKKYGVRDRGNPAREIGDTVVIHDVYGNHGKAIVTELDFDFSAGISCETGGVGT